MYSQAGHSLCTASGASHSLLHSQLGQPQPMRSHPMHGPLGPCAASPSYVRPTGPVCGQPGLCAASPALAPRAFDSQPPAPATRPGPAPRPWPPRSSPVPGALSPFWLSPRGQRVGVSGAPPALAPRAFDLQPPASAPRVCLAPRPRPRAPALAPARGPFFFLVVSPRPAGKGVRSLALAPRAFDLQPGGIG